MGCFLLLLWLFVAPKWWKWWKMEKIFLKSAFDTSGLRTKPVFVTQDSGVHNAHQSRCYEMLALTWAGVYSKVPKKRPKNCISRSKKAQKLSRNLRNTADNRPHVNLLRSARCGRLQAKEGPRLPPKCIIITVKECDKKNVPHQESNLGPATWDMQVVTTKLCGTCMLSGKCCINNGPTGNGLLCGTLHRTVDARTDWRPDGQPEPGTKALFSVFRYSAIE